MVIVHKEWHDNRSLISDGKYWSLISKIGGLF